MNKGKRCTAEALKEKGWTVKYMGLCPYAAPVGVTGHNDRYVVGPHYSNSSQGYMLMDHARRVMCVVCTLPTPRLAPNAWPNTEPR
jgi:hypothetical protein